MITEDELKDISNEVFTTISKYELNDVELMALQGLLNFAINKSLFAQVSLKDIKTGTVF